MKTSGIWRRIFPGADWRMAGRGNDTTSTALLASARVMARRGAAGVLIAAMLVPPVSTLANDRAGDRHATAGSATPSPVAADSPAPAATPSPKPEQPGLTGDQPGRNGRKDRSRRHRDDARQHRTALLPELGRAPSGSSAPWAGGFGSGSVRPRGAAAPVRLEESPDPVEPAAKPPKNPAAESSRAVGSDAHGGNNDGRSTSGKSEDKPLHGRIWPMPSGSYTFTQEYGCVPQIEGFYAAAADCPPDRPVVHSGIDLGAEIGALIYAAASGWVTQAGYDRETGLANTRLVIQHDGRNQQYATEYLHWITTFVEPGDYVRVGEPIAEVGSVGWSTGPHLHFAVIDFDRGGYLDPLAWLPRRDSAAYRDLPRNPKPVSFDHPDASPSGVPDAADPNPAPVPERADLPGKHERVKDAKDEDRKAARAERKAMRLDREDDRAERATERRRRIRHADGETVVDDTSGTGPGSAPPPTGDAADDPSRDRRGHRGARGDGSTDSNRTGHTGQNDGGDSRRDRGSNDGGRQDRADAGDDGQRNRAERSSEVESGDAGSEPGLSSRVASILDEIP